MMPAKSHVLAALSIAALASFPGCASDDLRPEKPINYPLAPDKPRVQFLKSYGSSDDVDRPGLLRRLLLGNKADEHKVFIGKTSRLRVLAEEALHSATGEGSYILDYDKKTLQPLEQNEQYVQFPAAIAIAEDGTKYVADVARKLIVVFDQDDKYVTALGDPASWKPVGVAVTKDKVYAADMDNWRIQIFDRKTGAHLGGFGGPGSEEGRFNRPSAITTDAEGNVYVTDSVNFRVQKFEWLGPILEGVRFTGEEFGQFGRPAGLTVDREGRLYVLDKAYNAVQIFDKEGRLLLVYGQLGPRPGDLYLPSGITISYDAVDHLEPYVATGREIEYTIFVTNQFGPNKVSTYGLLKQLPGDDVAPVGSNSLAGSVGPDGASEIGNGAPSAERVAAEMKPADATGNPHASAIEIPADWISDQERARRAEATRKSAEAQPVTAGEQPTHPEVPNSDGGNAPK